ncbi:MAG: type II secretion system protein [Phycisphaerales bacterium]|jgi:prepilin-type N-terminal cleavage/methylation domain-containing protein|nr:type II secretion system protein [Phycisphaerales bacterium]
MIGPASRRGFSLIELVIVLAIIGVLIAMSATGLMYLKRHAGLTEQANDLRQVGLAWKQYSVDSRDRFVPGWISRETQKELRLVLTYPDGHLIPPAPTFEEDLPDIAAPWTWRLAPHLGSDLVPLLDREARSALPIVDYPEYGEQIAYHPAFAYNGWYVGGHYDMSPATGRPRLEFTRARLSDRTHDNVVAESLGKMKRPASTYVFMAGALMPTARSWGISDADEAAQHWFEVTPPILADQRQWNILSFDDIETFEADVAIPRIGSDMRLPVYFADGHVASQSATDLADQSHWIDAAKMVKDIPAKQFTHEAE